MIEIIYDDILNANTDIIVHQVNCMGVMGAGLALFIKKEYPRAYKVYRNACIRNDKKSLLGKIQMVSVGDGKFICNMFAQLEYGRNKVQTDYNAIEECMDKIYTFAKLNNLTVAIPYNIGCGLAGGDWNTVKSIIESRFKDKSIVKFYKK